MKMPSGRTARVLAAGLLLAAGRAWGEGALAGQDEAARAKAGMEFDKSGIKRDETASVRGSESPVEKLTRIRLGKPATASLAANGAAAGANLASRGNPEPADSPLGKSRASRVITGSLIALSFAVAGALFLGFLLVIPSILLVSTHVVSAGFLAAVTAGVGGAVGALFAISEMADGRNPMEN